MAFGASVVLQSKSGERSIPMHEFFKAPGVTEATPEEILTKVELTLPEEPYGAEYLALGVRKTLEIKVVNVASFLSLNSDGTIKDARVILGSVGPTHIRAKSAEKILIGEKPDETLFDKAKDAASGDCTPIDDFRGSANYRRAMVRVLTKRALTTSYEKALSR